MEMYVAREGTAEGSFLFKACLEAPSEKVTCVRRPKPGMWCNLQRPGSRKGELGLVAAHERGQCGGGTQGS